MSRPLRREFDGACYHVRARGNARGAIFLDDEDRAAFIRRLSFVTVRLEWSVLAYCLMLNHYHLLVRTATPTLARGMRDLNGEYSQRFNRRHDRVGHVFEGRYRASVVGDDAYLLEVARYIALNPVRAGLCATPDEWRWSSYRASLGRAERWPGLRDDQVLRFFSRVAETARDLYEEFVMVGVESQQPLPSEPPWTIGGDSQPQRGAESVGASSEIPRAERRCRTLSDFQRSASTRDEAIRLAYSSGTYSLREIGDHFGLHYSSVSHIVRGRQRTVETPVNRTLQSKT